MYMKHESDGSIIFKPWNELRYLFGLNYPIIIISNATVIREEKMKKEKGERTKMEWNISARTFHPQEKKGEQKEHKRMDKGETIELYPKGG